MTAGTGQVSDWAQVSEWKLSTSVAKRIAADLWEKILTGRIHRYAEFPSVQSIREEWKVGSHTVGNAKRLLYSRGVLCKEANKYYLA